MADPFATAGELARFLSLAEPTDLARWQQHLRAASGLVRGFTGQVLSPVAGDQIVLQPSYTANLYLPERPVTDITEVLEDVTALTAYTFSQGGVVTRDSGTWTSVTTITYDHGWVEFSPEYETIKAIVLEIAARSVTNNERSASEALGTTILETAGYAPEAFLTQGERWQLMDFGAVGVG